MTSPTPTPTPDDLTAFGVEVLVSVGLLFLAGAVLGLVLLRLARHTPTALVTVSLSILTLLALMMYGVTEAEALIGVVGAGIGALAGALQALFNNPEGTDDETPR